MGNAQYQADRYRKNKDAVLEKQKAAMQTEGRKRQMKEAVRRHEEKT